MGHRHANVLIGEIDRNRIDSEPEKSDALPNFNTERHSSKLRHGSRTQRLSSNGKIFGVALEEKNGVRKKNNKKKFQND